MAAEPAELEPPELPAGGAPAVPAEAAAPALPEPEAPALLAFSSLFEEQPAAINKPPKAKARRMNMGDLTLALPRGQATALRSHALLLASLAEERCRSQATNVLSAA